ncbi:orotidine-5'-phosphate decarboxylase [Thorsellia anophelis]|uniref:Orotidine 5'-phosphate decarboxylase n=1 Tax=Thorsellia anophelis DSM 18579 TaxID=1123402 RepID=A0A1I0BYT9_9GAMM|nr:orotidine-5'-phosphate decarboxylase [Thorsellia anophelis]SET12218.1 orotidine-5'-phosphate decarboxylase [Thorsellia anophelis DSM 18579]
MSEIIIALDYNNKNEALSFIETIDPKMAKLKVGKEMFTRYGPEFIRLLHDKHFDVFLDLKFHDIPNTVASALKAAADLGVWMVNVHASGGERMLSAAKTALESYGKDAPLLIAVTVLTSMEQEDLTLVGITHKLLDHTLTLAELTKNAGLDGVVCSAHEAIDLRNKFGENFKLITPGIRLENMSSNDDQRRIVTPQKAKEFGVDYIVMGRPITGSSNPTETLKSIFDSLNQ